MQRVITLPCLNIGPRYGLFVDGVVRDTKCRFLIDTGSTDTLISSTVYYQMPTEQRPVLETDDVTVRQIDGSPLPVMGIAWVEVQVGRTTHLLKATFIEMNYSALLGMDFLVHTGGKLDFQLKELRLNGEIIKCTTSAGEPFVGREEAVSNGNCKRSQANWLSHINLWECV